MITVVGPREIIHALWLVRVERQHLTGTGPDCRRGPLVPAAAYAAADAAAAAVAHRTASRWPRGRRRVRLVDHVLAGLRYELLERDDQRQDQRYFADDHRLAGHQEQHAERQRDDHHRLHRGRRHHHAHGLFHFSPACEHKPSVGSANVHDMETQ